MGLFPEGPARRQRPSCPGLPLPCRRLRPSSSGGPRACLPVLLTGLLSPVCCSALSLFRCWPSLGEKSLTCAAGSGRMIHRDPPSLPQSWGFCIGDFSVGFIFSSPFGVLKEPRQWAVCVFVCVCARVCGGGSAHTFGEFSNPYRWPISHRFHRAQSYSHALTSLVSF